MKSENGAMEVEVDSALGDCDEGYQAVEEWAQRLSDVPARCLNYGSRAKLSMFLNPRVSYSVSNHGLCQDWTGFAEGAGFEYYEIQAFEAFREDPMKRVLDVWTVKPGATLGKLLRLLLQLDRLDLLEDDGFRGSIDRDAARYIEGKNACVANERPVQVNQVVSSSDLHRSVQPSIPYVQPSIPYASPRPVPDFPTDEHQEMLVDELAEITSENIIYDALVAYAEEDWWFVKRLLDNLEKPEHGIKLCIDIRNLLAGGHENTITAEVIQNRCRRVLLIISKNFLNSPSCEFQFKFTQSLSPGARSKKMIPIVIQHVPKQDLPAILRPICMLHYNNCGNPEWFWAKLRNSVKAKVVQKVSPNCAELRQITMKVPSQSVSESNLLPPGHHQEASSSSRAMVQEGSSCSSDPPSMPMVQETSSSGKTSSDISSSGKCQSNPPSLPMVQEACSGIETSSGCIMMQEASGSSTATSGKCMEQESSFSSSSMSCPASEVSYRTSQEETPQAACDSLCSTTDSEAPLDPRGSSSSLRTDPSDKKSNRKRFLNFFKKKKESAEQVM